MGTDCYRALEFTDFMDSHEIPYRGNLWLMFGKLIVVGKKKYSEWIDSAIRRIKFGLENHGRFAKLSHCQTFLTSEWL